MRNSIQHLYPSILNLIKEGKKPKEIATILNISISSVNSFCYKQNIKFSKIAVPNLYHKEIHTLLLEGKRPIEIAKTLNLHKVSVNSYIKKKFNYNFSSKYDIDSTYFAKIDSPQKAYWLGFIAADGCLIGNVLTITLQYRDKILLENFKQCLNLNKPLLEIKRPSSFDKNLQIHHIRLSFGDKNIINDLKSYGLTERKSLTMKDILQFIPEEYKVHYIIGYMDGDGAVLCPKDTTNSVYISFRGTFAFLKGIKDYLKVTANISFHKTSCLTISNKQSVITLFKGYKDLNYFLVRKYEKFFPRINSKSYKQFL